MVGRLAWRSPMPRYSQPIPFFQSAMGSIVMVGHARCQCSCIRGGPQLKLFRQGLRLNAFFVPAFQSDLIRFFQIFLYFLLENNDSVAKPMLWQF